MSNTKAKKVNLNVLFALRRGFFGAKLSQNDVVLLVILEERSDDRIQLFVILERRSEDLSLFHEVLLRDDKNSQRSD